MIRLRMNRCLLAPLAAALSIAGPALASEQRPLWSDWTPFAIEQPKWDGRYLSVSSGFEVVSYGRGRTYAGPTLGIEAGQFWREGDVVYGFSGAINYMKSFSSGGSNNSAFSEFSRDFAGVARFKAGYLVAPNFMVYGAVGVSAQNESWRHPVALGGGTDHRFAVRPEVSAGFDWMVNSTTRIYGEVTVSPQAR